MMKKETETTLKLIKNRYGVDSTQVFRKLLLFHTNENLLKDLDGKIQFALVIMTLLSSVWLAAGLPNEVRIEFLLVSGTMGLIYGYGLMEDAVDIRILLWSSFWYFTIVAIPAGVLFGVGILIVTFTNFVVPGFDIQFLLGSLIGMYFMMFAFLVAILRGSIVRKKVSGLWKYIQKDKAPSSLSMGLQFIRLHAQSSLLFLSMLSILTFLVRIMYLYPTTLPATLILLLPLLFFGREMMKCLRGSEFSSQLVSLAKESSEFSTIVTQLGEKKARKKRFLR